MCVRARACMYVYVCVHVYNILKGLTALWIGTATFMNTWDACVCACACECVHVYLEGFDSSLDRNCYLHEHMGCVCVCMHACIS